MNLLPKIKVLLRYCQMSLSLCEAALQKLSREIAELQQQEQALIAQINGLQQLLQQRQPASTVMRREQFFTMLRKQAVLRQQIQQLNFQLSQLQQQRKKTEQQRTTQLKQHKLWQRKEGKYQRRASFQRRQNFILDLRFEETELEDILNGYSKASHADT